jgi:hypothetical protein
MYIHIYIHMYILICVCVCISEQTGEYVTWRPEAKPSTLQNLEMTKVQEGKESEPARLLTVHEFPRIQLFLNNHSQYIKISTLLSRVKGVAGETVNSLSEQMITEPRSPFVLGGRGHKFPESICRGELLCIHHVRLLHHS